MGSLIIRGIFFFLSFALWVTWALDAYRRVMDPNINPEIVPINETVSQWWVRVTTSMIYFMLLDVVSVFGVVFTAWWELKPLFRLGTLVIFILLAGNIFFIRRERKRIVMRTVYCERDGFRGIPVRGSYNRYRCRDGHQFAGDPHGI